VGTNKRSETDQVSRRPAATGTLIVRAVAVGGDPVDLAELASLPAPPAGRVVVDGADELTRELQDGLARFDGLPAGEHTVEVHPADGFGAPAELYRLDRHGRPVPADSPIAVGPGEEVTVVAACRRTHVLVAGGIELQAPGKAKPRRVDWAVPLEVHRPGRPRTTVTSDKGGFEAMVEADGPVELVAPSHTDAGGRRFVPRRPRTMVEPDGEPVRLTYHEAGAIRVAGSLEDETGTRLVPGVHFTLRDADLPDEVLRDATSSRRRPVVLFDDLVPGSYLVVADHDTVRGFPPLQLVQPPEGQRSVEVAGGETTDLTGAFQFEQEPAIITGQVRAATGGGLTGITVELRDPASEEPAGSDLTDDDGRYLFADVEPGLWVVHLDEQVVDVDQAPWRPRPPDDGERPVTALPGQTVEAADIVLDPAPGGVLGRVVDDGDRGVPGVEVALEPADGGVASRTRLSDGNGWFVFESVEPGRYILRLDRPIQAAGELLEPVAGDTDRREVEVASGFTSAAPTFRLARRRRVGTVSGRLRDGDGDGIPGVPVRLLQDGQQPDLEATDARGVYTFTGVAPGVQLVGVPTPVTAGGIDWRPVPPDAGQRTVLVRAGATAQVPDIELEPVPVLRTITGSVLSVLPDGTANGLAGVALEVRPAAGGPPLATVTTGPGGAFSVRVPAGTWAIEPVEVPIRIGALAFEPLPPGDSGTRVVQVGAQDEVADPLVVRPVPAPVAITGRVLDAGVNPAAGLPGVRLRLRPVAGGAARFAVTGPGGGFTFANVQNGRFVVELEETPFELANAQWEPVIGDSGARDVTVQDRPADVGSLLVQRERHRIVGAVTRPDGSPAAFLPIRVLDELGQRVVEVTTDFDGNYDADLDREGRFIVEFQQDDRPIRRPVTVESDVRLDLTIDDAGGAALAATQDFAAFPVLTEEVSRAQLPAAGAPASSVGQTVEAALREALGWRPRPNDPRSFNAALIQSFSRIQVEGHTEATWTPRTYAAQVQSDLGAITGAQASLYSRARVALDAALPLLDGLYPLDPAADPQDTEATRSIIRTELNELVTELGVEGGPRVSRVDDLLNLLLRDRLPTRVVTSVAGHLGQLEDRFGLDTTRVQSIEEEENLTNFLILVDYVKEIDTSWATRRSSFDPASGATPFLGTQLVLLSRSLAVTAESVSEVGFTLDSVFLGPAERLAIRLTFPATDSSSASSKLVDSQGKDVFVDGDTPSILLAELLSWVERVASEEGPRLLQDGGKDGASALTPVLERLRALVRASLVNTGVEPNKGLQSPNNLPAGYSTARVQRALSELAKYLDDSAALAGAIQR
jgi:hypothetical protein